MDTRFSGLNERFHRIANCFLTICVELPDSSSDKRTSVFSGFVVERRGKWIWITADHVFDPDYQGLDLLESIPNARVILKAIGDDSLHPIFYAYRKENRVRVVERAQEDLLNPDIHPEERQWLSRVAQDLDIGAMLLTTYFVDHLRILGIKPLNESEICTYDAECLSWLDGPALSLCLAGVPMSAVVSESNAFSMQFKVLPVAPCRDHPKWDAYDPPFALFEAMWSETDHIGSVKGFSGGPIFVTDGERTVLVAVQFSEEIAGKHVLRAIDPRPLFVLIDRALDKLTQDGDALELATP